jgi:uncharacterized protein (DUF2062 family)
MTSADPQTRIPGWLGRLAGLSDSPDRTAAAFAFGVFLSFSPLFGLQIAVGLGVAVMMRLNRVAVFVGLCSNLPWVMVPWYAVTTAAGAALLGVPISPDISARLGEVFDLSVYTRAFWRELLELIWPYFGSFVLGSMIGAALLGGVAFMVTRRLLKRAHAARTSP